MLYKPTLGQIVAGNFHHHPRYRGCVGHWLIGEGAGLTAYDIGPNKNNGTLTGGPAWTSGLFGSTLQFDGSNDYINLPANLSIFRNVSQMSGSVWVKLDSIASNREVISIGNNSGGSASRFALDYASGAGWRCGARAGDAEGFQAVTTTTNATAGVWYHLVGTVDLPTDTVLIYVNGLLAATTGSIVFSASVTSDTNSSVSALGAEDNGGSNFFIGIIDDVRLYNRALSAQEVWSLYTNPFLEFQSFSRRWKPQTIAAGGVIGPLLGGRLVKHSILQGRLLGGT